MFVDDFDMENITYSNESVICQANTVQGCLNLAVSVTSIGANLIVIITIVMSRHLHHPTLWLITLMALFDLLSALYFLAFVVPSAFLGCFAYWESVLGLASILRVALNCQNIQNTMLLTLDRYLSVEWPLRYVHIATNRTCVTAVLLTFLLNVGFSVVVQLSSHEATYNVDISISLQEIRFGYGAAAIGIFICSSFIIILFCSVSLLRAVFRSRRKIVSAGQSANTVARSSFMVSISSIVFFVTYSPVPIISALGKENLPNYAVRFASMVLNSSGLWNVFIYITTYLPFREAVLALFCKAYYRRQLQAQIMEAYKARNWQ